MIANPRIQWSLLTLLALVMASIGLSGCNSEGAPGSTVLAPQDTSTTDSLWFVSVVPDSALKDGRYTTFQIQLAYRLSTKAAGTVNVGLNNNDTVVNLWPTLKSLPIAKGTGTLSFSIAGKVKNWGVRGSFSIISIIIDSPYTGGPVLTSTKWILIPTVY